MAASQPDRLAASRLERLDARKQRMRYTQAARQRLAFELESASGECGKTAVVHPSASYGRHDADSNPGATGARAKVQNQPLFLPLPGRLPKRRMNHGALALPAVGVPW